ncbi:hypothetical protein X740_24670 [Mesorhizobium sp. LNHC221B00]|nr:hypothetical protein X740_24670 [Mesorhizobium sp. LNHC221B00]
MIPEGGFGPAAGVVVAESVLAKHDERYIPQGRGRGPQGQGGVWQESRNNQQLVLIRRLLLWPDEQ